MLRLAFEIYGTVRLRQTENLICKLGVISSGSKREDTNYKAACRFTGNLWRVSDSCMTFIDACNLIGEAPWTPEHLIQPPTVGIDFTIWLVAVFASG